MVVTPSGNVKVHLRLPTSFCSPNFAYLMASDAKDVLTELDWTRRVVVELDDHHDSSIINAGWPPMPDTAGPSATRPRSPSTSCGRRSGARRTPRRWNAASPALLRADPSRAESSLGEVRLGDLPDGDAKTALLKRRRNLGLSTAADALVMVDHDGRGYAADAVPMALRRARSTRISIDGNAHFCRGLLRTRYADEAPAFVALSTVTAPPRKECTA